MKKLCIILFSTVVFLLYVGLLSSPAKAETIMTGIRGQSVIITATLDGTAPPNTSFENQLIEFYDETHNLYIGANITNSVGFAWMNWTIPIDFPLGPILINATFRGNTSLALAPCVQYSNLIIMASTYMTVEYNESIVAPFDSLKINVSLFEKMDTPIICTRVYLLFSGNIIQSVFTDERGYALFNPICNSSWLNFGTNTLDLFYPGNDTSYTLPYTCRIEIIMEKKPTDLLLSTNATRILLNETMIVNVSLFSENNFLSAGSIHAFLDGVDLGPRSLENTGNLTFHLFIGANVTLGDHSLVLHFPGTERYSPVSKKVEFTVLSFVLFDIKSSGPHVLNAPTNITIHTFDILQRPVSGILSLYDQNTSSFVQQLITEKGITTVPVVMFGNPGIHTFNVSILNPYILNYSLIHNFILYSRPTIFKINSSIFGVASPSQRFTVTLKITNETGCWSYGDVLVNTSYSETYSLCTDYLGTISIIIMAPEVDGDYCLFISTIPHQFELSQIFIFNFSVNRQMPVNVTLLSYDVIPSLQRVDVTFLLFGLNGTPLHNVPFHYEWLSTNAVSYSNHGIISLSLSVPPTNGNYTLVFSINTSSSISGKSGYFTLFFTSNEILSSQGIGVIPFVATLFCSTLVIGLSIIRKKLLIN